MNIVREIGTFGRWLDQPALVARIHKVVPAVLGASAAGYGIYDTFNNKSVKEGKETKLKRFIKNASILGFTVGSALIFGKRFIEKPHLCEGKLGNLKDILNNIPDLSKQARKSLEGMRNNPENLERADILSIKEVRKLYEGFGEKAETVLSTRHSHDGVFDEIKALSVLGTIPVIGGIAGGVVGDALTGEDVKKKLPDKIKEGAYQYLANIVLCNVGALAALLTVEQTPYKNNKAVKFFSMLAGILAVGVAGGNVIANSIGKNFIDPMLGHKHIHNHRHNERKPEALDIGLHIDDVAAAGFLSGLSWIGPALPVLYSISGYRAGIGYRNNKKEIRDIHNEYIKKANELCNKCLNPHPTHP